MQTAHTANGKNILSIMKQEKNKEINERNNFALNEVRSLKSFYPDCMIWFKPIRGHFIFLVVNPECREIIEVLDTVNEGSTPLSDDDFHEYINELMDLISEPPNWFKRWEDSQVGSLEHSIDRFLEENVELSDKVSLDLHLEDERFYDSPIWD